MPTIVTARNFPERRLSQTENFSEDKTLVKLRFKDYLVMGSLFFGMIFGAGNLIFPVHLGQLAGSHWLAAAGGFLLSGVLLPLLALLALGLSRSNGLDDLARPLGNRARVTLVVLIQLLIGPLFVTPRTTTVSFTVGISSFLPAHLQGGGLLIYSALFFLFVYLATVNESKITALIGKYLNPLFLVILATLFVLAFLHPFGAAGTAPATAAYQHQALANGFLQGYNTMDVLASLVFGITIIAALKDYGITKPAAVSLATIKSGLVGMAGVAAVYLGLIWLGATSRHRFALASNGGVTLAQLAHAYLGLAGDLLLAVLTILACITTAMGLMAAFAQDFHQLFPRVSYKNFLRAACLVSFLVANLGLDLIIQWSTPVLAFVYPLAITLVLLGITSPYFGKAPLVYQLTMGLVTIPAFFDLLKSLPPVLAKTPVVSGLVKWGLRWLPLYSLGFAWVPFALVGGIVAAGWVHWRTRRRPA